MKQYMRLTDGKYARMKMKGDIKCMCRIVKKGGKESTEKNQ